MQVKFTYEREKNIWCLMNKGGGSNNSATPTKQYEILTAQYGDSPSLAEASMFIDNYIAQNKIDVSGCIRRFQDEWDSFAAEFQKRAEQLFNVSLPDDIVVYLTVNGRCPYNISGNYFYVSLQSTSSIGTVMHEQWHFLTWYGFGRDQEQILGKQRYNDLKESLTVLLNVECKDLLPEGAIDTGYPQHVDIRNQILAYWKQDKSINLLWTQLASKAQE